MKQLGIQSICLLSVVLLTSFSVAQDWTRFRGPNGSGVAAESEETPVEWSDSKNLKWKIDLPGPGHSSPIIVGDNVLLTCWTGYGVDGGSDKQEDLRLHLLCYSRESGEQKWGKAIEPTLPEENYGGMFAEHGYATHTPASDGEHVWAFFGKSGAVCFDLEGNEVWRKNLGKDLDPKRWGSSSSPILYKDIVIYPATVESNTLYGLNKLTGEEVWKQQADGLASTWGTPVLAKVDEERTDLVLAVPYEIWGFDPETGKFLWYTESVGASSACASAIAVDDVVYYVESGRDGGGAIAVRAGGKDDVSKSHVLWKSGDRSRIGTPVAVDDHLFWVSGGIATCIDASNGEKVYTSRLEKPAAAGGAAEPEPQGGGGGRRGGGRRGGGGGGQDYGSPVAANGKMYYVSRKGEMFVIELGKEFNQLAANTFSDGGEFSASPAISDGQLFVRSTKCLYCIANQE